MAFFLDLAVGDTLLIGDSQLKLEKKSGQRARLAINSTKDVERIKAGEPVPDLPADQKAPDTAPERPPPRTRQAPFLRR